jgi:hypothetical protein
MDDFGTDGGSAQSVTIKQVIAPAASGSDGAETAGRSVRERQMVTNATGVAKKGNDSRIWVSCTSEGIPDNRQAFLRWA